MSRIKQTKILKNKPLPKAKLIDLSALPDKKQEEIYRDLTKNVAVIMAEPGVAGYALVVWHMDGTVSSSHWAARGMIGRSMIPALAHDILLKRIAVLDAKADLEDEGKIGR